nr:helitron helicase-like domain-containing protein [Tanacetum cinerariifolium]
MRHFGGIDNSELDAEIVEGARGYELPASNVLGAVVFDNRVSGITDFNVIIQEKAESSSKKPWYTARKATDRRIGPYVFKVSGQVYYWIGSLCPLPGESLRFLQLYIYDTDHEVENRMRHFGGIDNSELDAEIVEGARGYELLASNVLGAVVFDSRVSGSTDFNVIIQEKAERVDFLSNTWLGFTVPSSKAGYNCIRKKQKDIRGDQLSGLYDAISRGERDGYEVGGRIILPMSFTGGPR